MALYPLNSEVLMVPVTRDRYSPVRVLTCDQECLHKIARALAHFWTTVPPSYSQQLQENDTLVTLFKELCSWDYTANNAEDLREKCAHLVRVWCDMKLCKQLLAKDKTMLPFQVVPQRRTEPPTVPHRTAYYDSNFGLLSQDLAVRNESTYDIHTVSPVEIRVEYNQQWAVTKRLTMLPVAAGSALAEKFWDTDSTLRIMELFVRDYETHSELHKAEILTILEPLRQIFYNTGDFKLSYSTVSTYQKYHYYYACCLVLFCKFLLVWQTPCLNNPECQLRPSAVDSNNFRRRRTVKQTNYMSPF